MRDLMDLTPDDVAEHQSNTLKELDALNKASSILRRGGKWAYKKAMRALTDDSRNFWFDHVEKEEYEETAEGLAKFIQKIEPINIAMEKEARHHEAIKAHALGEGFQAFKLEMLNRYETHLDRKFERTLAMLLKLKEINSSR